MKIIGSRHSAWDMVNTLKVTDKVLYWVKRWGDTVRVYKATPVTRARVFPPKIDRDPLGQYDVIIDKYVGQAPSKDPWVLVAAIPAVIPLEEVALLVTHPMDAVREAVQKRLAR